MIYADSARQLGGAADRLNCCGNGFHARKVGISNIAPSTGLLGIATHAAADFGTDTKMNAGEVIRTLRKARGISQSALAAEIGWERGTIAAVEAGHDRPGAELVEALATFFQTSTDHILGRDGTRQPNTVQTETEAELLARFRDAGPDGKIAVIATLRAMTNGRQ